MSLTLSLTIPADLDTVEYRAFESVSADKLLPPAAVKLKLPFGVDKSLDELLPAQQEVLTRDCRVVLE